MGKDVIHVRQILENELDWINSKYDEVGFVNSNAQNEYIVIAEIQNKPAGIGRLVRIDQDNVELGGIYVFPGFRNQGVADSIVSELFIKNPFIKSTVWCLPFENLRHFYVKFGFRKPNASVEIPLEIGKKWEWCNQGKKYHNKVLLLFKVGDSG